MRNFWACKSCNQVVSHLPECLEMSHAELRARLLNGEDLPYHKLINGILEPKTVEEIRKWWASPRETKPARPVPVMAQLDSNDPNIVGVQLTLQQVNCLLGKHEPKVQEYAGEYVLTPKHSGWQSWIVRIAECRHCRIFYNRGEI